MNIFFQRLLFVFNIIQTFRRYDYEIMTHFEEDLHLQELKEHSDFLRRYLEMGS
jgi:uncharacterized membrane protein (DUF373 family)